MGVMTPNRFARALPLMTMFVLAACGSSASSTAPSAARSPTAAPSVLPSPTGSAPAPAAGQTDTEWGRIWDTLPGNFPVYPGSTQGDETATGPASANLVVDGLDAKGIVIVFQTLLKQAGYQTVGLQGPLEDGSYVLDMTGPTAGCRIQVGAAPTGSLTILTILYGAACPHG
jgi:hypothetical protein